MDYSKELCGGTHVSNTKEISKLAVLSVESKGSGIFRVEAVTGNNLESGIEIALSGLEDNINLLKDKYAKLQNTIKQEGFNIDFVELPCYEKVNSYQDVLNKRRELEEVSNILKDCEKKYEAAYREKNSSNYNDFMSNSKVIDDVTYLIQKVENIDVNVLKDIIDKLTANLNKTVVFFADVVGDKIIFIAKQKNTSFVCGNLVKEAAIITGGNGGGRPDFAQAGGKDVSKVDDALAKINDILGL